jgi:hypothetical protein
MSSPYTPWSSVPVLDVVAEKHMGSTHTASNGTTGMLGRLNIHLMASLVSIGMLGGIDMGEGSEFDEKMPK